MEWLSPVTWRRGWTNKAVIGIMDSMPAQLEKIFTSRLLLAVNILIIILTEASGEWFHDTGIIHLVAILFVCLGISCILTRRSVYDQYLQPLIRGGSAALLIFALSHLVEYVSFLRLHSYDDVLYVNVVNFYLISILAFTAGAEYFIHTVKRSSHKMFLFLWAGILLFFFLTILFFFGYADISIDPEHMTPYVYGAVVISISALSMNHLRKIKSLVGIMSGFINYFQSALALITVSALLYIFYELIEDAGMSEFQIIYISHFLFYGALSFMFLAFAKLSHLGGLYDEVEAYRHRS